MGLGFGSRWFKIYDVSEIRHMYLLLTETKASNVDNRESGELTTWKPNANGPSKVLGALARKLG